VVSDIASSSSPELATALHRLRSTLARMRAELEVAEADGGAPPVEVVLGDLRHALELLGDVESEAFSLIRVLVVDDDERLGELTARGLRRLGYEAEWSASMRLLRAREILVVDLGVAASLDAANRAELKDARPIVVTGAADPASRALAADLAASDYLVKPVEPDELVAAIKRRLESA
jgi:CheY-like chemotaxis protein